MFLNYQIGCFVLGLLCVGVWVRFGWGGIRVAGYSNTQQTKNETANVVVHHHSRILLKIGICMPETC